MDIQIPDTPSKYRPAPFWSWNADLKPEELRWQIRQMHAAGLGGFFMHARGGLQTAYLSDEWMKCVEASLDEAGKLGMDAWLYDENGWPSGFGGGLVNALGEKFQLKYLRCEIIDAADTSGRDKTIGFYSEKGDRFLGTELSGDISGKVMRCFYEVNQFYVDNLDAGVVAEFIRVTHQHYYEKLPEKLLKHLRGIFTDEPQLSRDGMLWSFVLADEYRKAYNEELIPKLGELFSDLPQSAQTRIRFWKLCSDLFSKAFMKQIHDWCKLHNWELTGHHVLEEFLSFQTNSNGSIMPQYRYYTLPGVDHLGRSLPSNIAAVQLFSVAQQYGIKQLLTESFALTGWACNFSGMRWVYQSQMAHGINYLCQHLQSYSLRGCRKRDYPQSSFYHQPWWSDYKILNDYFARTGKILADGTTDTEVVVIHPISSMWKVFAGDCDALRNFSSQKSLEDLTTALDARICQHHYADEIIVDECGSTDGDRFVIGNCRYRIVIIPRLTNISRKIFTMLTKFQRNGGIILKIKEKERDGAMTIDGIPADHYELDFLNKIPAFDSEYTAAEYVAKTVDNPINVLENGVAASSLVGTWRDTEISGFTGRFYFFANNNYHCGGKFHLELPESGKKVACIDPADGKLYRLPEVTDNGKTLSIRWDAGAADAISLFAADGLPVDELPELKRISADASAIRLLMENNWQVTKVTENILTLDNCRYCIDGKITGSCAPIDLQTRLLDLERPCDLELAFDFNVDDDFDRNTPVYLVVESPEKYSFALNGEKFTATPDGYLFDKAFARILLPGNIHTGVNTISMQIRFEQPPETYEMIRRARIFESEYNKLTFETEIESIYLCGNFSIRHHGVTVPAGKDASFLKGTFALGSPVKGDIVNCRNLVNSGLPFFAGKVTLKNSFTLTAEELKKIEFFSCTPKGSNSIKVRVNGEDCGSAFWAPFAVPVKDKLQQGFNTIEVDLTISLRNMLGPHHLKAGESYGVTTLSFNLEPTLLRRNPQPSTPDYCMVDFGLSEIKFTD